MSDIPNIMRTPTGNDACRAVGIDPDENPCTAALAAIIPPEHYLNRVLPPAERGCAWPGRFDHEDNARHAGWGPAPGEGPCDYPQGCPAHGDAAYHCPFENLQNKEATPC